MESSGTVPVKFWFESSISVTKLSELQVIPVKWQMEYPVGSHELNTLVVESWSVDLSFKRICSSSDLTPERKERKQSR